MNINNNNNAAFKTKTVQQELFVNALEEDFKAIQLSDEPESNEKWRETTLRAQAVNYQCHYNGPMVQLKILFVSLVVYLLTLVSVRKNRVQDHLTFSNALKIVLLQKNYLQLLKKIKIQTLPIARQEITNLILHRIMTPLLFEKIPAHPAVSSRQELRAVIRVWISLDIFPMKSLEFLYRQVITVFQKR